MRRIGFVEGFQQIVDSGQTREAALNGLNEERNRGLRVWCDGRLMASSEVLDLRFRFNDANKPVVFHAVYAWNKPADAYLWELDADQIEALIAGAQRGRPPSKRKEWALAEIHRMINDGKEVTAGTVRDIWKTKYEPIPDRNLKSQMRQFRRWIATIKRTGRKGGHK